MAKLVLQFDSKIVGFIVSCEHDDGAWMVGNIRITDFGYEIRDFLVSLTDEADGKDVPVEFPIQLMDEKKWSIVDQENGNVRSIELPAVFFDDNSIYWRWS